MIEEWCLRGIVVQRTELITKMKAMVISHEHPNPRKKEDPKEKDTKKYFHPKLLAAADWSKDVLDASLEKLNATCSSKIQCVSCWTFDVVFVLCFLDVIRLNA